MVEEIFDGKNLENCEKSCDFIPVQTKTLTYLMRDSCRIQSIDR